MFFAGCSSKVMTNSLFDINNEYDVDGYPWQVQQVRLMNTNGLSPIRGVGEVYYLSPSRGIENAIPLLNNDINTTLYKKVIDYNTSINISTLYEIKSSILQLDKLSLDIAKYEIDLLAAIDSNDTNRSFNIQQDLNKSVENFDTNYSNFLIQQKHSSVLIAQWSLSNNNSYNASASTVAEINNKTAEDMSGFIIASGLKVESLYMDLNTSKQLEANFDDTISHRVGITTYMVSAENMLFINRSDHKKFLKAITTLSMKNMKGTLKKLDEISMNLSMAKSDRLFSSGQYAKPLVYNCEMNLTKSNSPINRKWTSLNSGHKCNESLIPVFSVFTEVDELDNVYH